MTCPNPWSSHFQPACWILYILLTLPASGFSEGFFTAPEAPFITHPKEKVLPVDLPAGPVEAAQTLIDSARKENPNAVLLLLAKGNLEVSVNPLRLGSKMCLFLSPSTGLTARADSSGACHSTRHAATGSAPRAVKVGCFSHPCSLSSSLR